MHVKAKTMAFSGLLLALTVIFMVLGSVIETSTLFLLAAASYNRDANSPPAAPGGRYGRVFHCY